MTEGVLLSAPSATVTQTTAKFSNTTFPLNSIESISLVEPKRTGPIVLGIVLMTIAGILAAGGDHGGLTLGVAATGFTFMGAAIYKKYVLIVRTANGDMRAASASSEGDLIAIKHRIERAATLGGSAGVSL